jgi:uncharacterized membrane protein
LFDNEDKDMIGTAIKAIIMGIGLLSLAVVGFAMFAVMYGIVLSFFGKDINWEDLEDESNNRKV